MDRLIEFGGTPGLLAAITVMLACHLLFKIGDFLWKFKKEKDTVTERSITHLSSTMQHNTSAMENLESRIKTLEHTIADVTRFKSEIRRLYAAIKLIAGDEWAVIRQSIAEDDLVL